MFLYKNTWFFRVFFKNLKTGEFCKNTEFFEKNTEFVKSIVFWTGNFWKNTEFFWGILDELWTGNFLKTRKFWKRHGILQNSGWCCEKRVNFSNDVIFGKMHEFLKKRVNFSNDVIFGKMHEFLKKREFLKWRHLWKNAWIWKNVNFSNDVIFGKNAWISLKCVNFSTLAEYDGRKYRSTPSGNGKKLIMY